MLVAVYVVQPVTGPVNRHLQASWCCPETEPAVLNMQFRDLCGSIVGVYMFYKLLQNCETEQGGPIILKRSSL